MRVVSLETKENLTAAIGFVYSATLNTRKKVFTINTQVQRWSCVIMNRRIGRHSRHVASS